MQNRPSPFLHRTPLTGTTREAFLARIRKDLGHPADRSPDPGQPPYLDPALIRQVPPNEPRGPLVDRWQKKMIENKATVHRIPNDPAAVLAALDACLANHQVSRALLNLQQLGEPAAVGGGIAPHLAGKNIQTFDWGAPNAFADAYHADVAITDAPAGLADTGALLVWSTPAFGRSSTLVTPIHITLLPASRILPDLVDGLEFVRQQNKTTPGGDVPSNVVVINGPSKTGDIEMKLVTGVHGPKFMYVLLIDD